MVYCSVNGNFLIAIEYSRSKNHKPETKNHKL
jgi:hypothetical protein